MIRVPYLLDWFYKKKDLDRRFLVFLIIPVDGEKYSIIFVQTALKKCCFFSSVKYVSASSLRSCHVFLSSHRRPILSNENILLYRD